MTETADCCLSACAAAGWAGMRRLAATGISGCTAAAARPVQLLLSQRPLLTRARTELRPGGRALLRLGLRGGHPGGRALLASPGAPAGQQRRRGLGRRLRLRLRRLGCREVGRHVVARERARDQLALAQLQACRGRECRCVSETLVLLDWLQLMVDWLHLMPEGLHAQVQAHAPAQHDTPWQAM